jgi:PEP-CTERM motif-containing protein
MKATRYYSFVAGIALCTILQPAEATTIPVFCDSNPNAIGEINVNPSGTGISGGFTSFVPAGTPSLAGAAAACGEHHYNWYQIVTADNQPPPGITPPYVDPPPGGYPLAFDPTWADALPWYYDEYAPNPVPPGRNVDNALQLSSRTHPNLLDFADFPGGGNGLNLSFKTWLVSLNADGSLHEFDSGFSWNFSIPAAGGPGSVTNIVSLGDEWFTDPHPPTTGEYNNIIRGFAASIPEPSSLFLMIGFGVLLVVVRHRKACP